MKIKQLLMSLLGMTLMSCGVATKDSCSSGCKHEPMQEVIKKGFERAEVQSKMMAESMKDMPNALPRTTDWNSKLITCDSRWWVSGFFPGTLWYLYEYTGKEEWKKWADMYTLRVEREKYTTNNHDVGFMIYCSFGNAYRLTGNERYVGVIDTASMSLCTRFDKRIDAIRSWNSNPKKWQYAVIIDNMMNLEMLMWASKKLDKPFYKEVAVKHADKTIAHHFRPDFSTYHVVSYDTISGLPHAKHTAQGYAHETAWARGQAWGLYGYTMMYRETKNEAYLTQAKNIAKYLLNHPNLPADKIPYWDFNAPNIPDAYRDVSAGSIICSALIELSGYVDEPLKKEYLDVAETQLRVLTTPKYMAEPGTNGGFILKHSVGHLMGKSEVDVPLTYADYYYLEALLRYKKLLENK